MDAGKILEIERETSADVEGNVCEISSLNAFCNHQILWVVLPVAQNELATDIASQSERNNTRYKGALKLNRFPLVVCRQPSPAQSNSQ